MQGILPHHLPMRCSVSLTIIVKVTTVFSYHHLIEWELSRKVYWHSPEPQNVLFIQLPNISLMEYTFLMGHTANIILS